MAMAEKKKTAGKKAVQETISTQETAAGKEASLPTLEEGFAMLDEITRTLGEENITLEKAFSEYKKGMDLLRICNEQIDRIEKQVLVLNEEGGLDEF